MNNEIAVFAKTTYRNEFKEFGIKSDDRRRHMYLIGKTGMGKSTILENMIVGDILAGRGVAVVDPHGDLAEKIINYIPDDRIKDLVYFNPSDIDYPIAFNVVEQVEPHLRHLVASGLIGVFQKLWADSWGPRLEYILRNAILAILDFPGSTLLGVVRMLSDKNYRKRVVANVKDPVVKAFWEKEFSSYADRFASEAVSPIQNKVGQFLSSSLMRNIVGQVRSSIDIRDIMDNSKILVMNLSKGRIGEDNSALLGAMMITKIQLAAMSRVDVLEKDRRDFYLYIDEFQNFSTDSFANILSEARKYRLNLILAHQYIEQLNEKVKPAVFGNVGTMIVFRVGATDAEELVKEFTPTFTEEDLVNLPKYEMYLKLMIDGISSEPFSAVGLPPLRDDQKTNNTQQAIDYSRSKYASDREEVERKIMTWHEDYTVLSSGNNKKKKVLATNKTVNIKAPNTTNNINNNKAKIVNEIKAGLEADLEKDIPSLFSSSDLISSNDNKNNKNNENRNNKAEIKASVVVSSPSGQKIYRAICSICGKETIVNFKPDGIRPIYCRECLSKKKAEKRQEISDRRLSKEKEKKELNLDSEADKKDIPSLSLNDLKNLKPRNFRGQEINDKIKIDSSDDREKSKTLSGELKEGKEVTINDNQF